MPIMSFGRSHSGTGHPLAVDSPRRGVPSKTFGPTVVRASFRSVAIELGCEGPGRSDGSSISSSAFRFSPFSLLTRSLFGARCVSETNSKKVSPVQRSCKVFCWSTVSSIVTSSPPATGRMTVVRSPVSSSKSAGQDVALEGLKIMQVEEVRGTRNFCCYVSLAKSRCHCQSIQVQVLDG